MPGTTTNNAFRIPLSTEAPDAPGQILALAQDVDAKIRDGGFTLIYGGDSGASTGNNGGTNGTFTRIGKTLLFHGRVLFGSSAVAGGGVVSGFNPDGTIDLRFSHGSGYYKPASGNLVPVIIRPITNFDASVLVVRDGYLAPFNTLGNPPQSSELFFHLQAYQV